MGVRVLQLAGQVLEARGAEGCPDNLAMSVRGRHSLGVRSRYQSEAEIILAAMLCGANCYDIHLT